MIGLAVTAIVVIALLLFTGGNDDKPATLGAIPTATNQKGKAAPTDEFERFDGTKATFADYRGHSPRRELLRLVVRAVRP